MPIEMILEDKNTTSKKGNPYVNNFDFGGNQTDSKPKEKEVKKPKHL